MTKSKILRYFLLIICVLLTGCVSAPQVKNKTLKPQNEVITLTWWAFPIFAQDAPQDVNGTYEKKIIKAFEEANPNIHIELTMLDFTTGPEKLNIALETGKACDILLDAPGRIISYGKSGYLASLNDMVDTALVKDVDNDALLKACGDGKNTYMLPLSSAPFYMAFNKKMLEQAGVASLVRAGWTTDEFTTVITALHQQGFVSGSIFCKDQGGDQGTRAFFSNLFDAEIIQPNLLSYSIASDRGMQTATYIKKCVEQGVLKNGTFENGTAAILKFVNGQAAFSLLWGPNQQKSYENTLADHGIEVVEVPYPSQDGKFKLEYLVNGFCVMDNDNSAKLAASKKFIRFMCDDAVWGPRNVIHTGCIPVRNSFGTLYAEERMRKIMGWTAYYAPYYNTVQGFSSMRIAWTQLLKNILNGYLPPEDAVKLFAEQANQTLK